jgi:hypothetical protein
VLLSSEQTGLLNVQWLMELVGVDKEHMEAIKKLEADFFYNRHFTFGSILQIYTYPVLPQLLKRKTYLSDGRTKWNWSIGSETLDTGWSYETL